MKMQKSDHLTPTCHHRSARYDPDCPRPPHTQRRMVCCGEVVAKTPVGLLACDVATFAGGGAHRSVDARPATRRTFPSDLGHTSGFSGPVLCAVLSARRIGDVVEEAEVVSVVDPRGVHLARARLVGPNS